MIVTQKYGNVFVSGNPLIQHYLTLMRDAGTPNGRFRSYLKMLARSLFYEAMGRLSEDSLDKRAPISTVKYSTPDDLEGKGVFIDSENYALVSTMRTGMAMSGAVQETLESAVVGHAYYLEKDLQTNVYGRKELRIPPLNHKFVFVFDSAMLSGEAILQLLREIVFEHQVHPSRIAVITSIATHAAIERINAEFHGDEHSIRIFTAAIDDWRNGEGFSRPGAGSFRRRMYGWIDD